MTLFLPVGLVADPVVHDLLGGTDDYKGIGIDLLNQSFEGADFPYGDNSVEYFFLLAGVAAFAPDDCDPAPDILEDFMGYFLPCGRNYHNRLALAEAGYDDACHLGADIDDDQGVENASRE